MNPIDTLRRFFFRTLLATPEGRAHVLSLMVAAEEGDEAGVFDRLIEHMDDPKLKRAIEAHQADEMRHAGLYRACLARNGLVEETAIPESLQVIQVIAEEAGGAFAAGDIDGIATKHDIMKTYALLLAIEERGVQQFPLIGGEFRRIGDAETADVFDQVTRDERGHVKSCQTLGRRYADDDAMWERTVEHFRGVEQRAFDKVGIATLQNAQRRGLIARGLLARVERRVRALAPNVA